MTPYRERVGALKDLWDRRLLFRARPFPTDWAKVVNGVGLVSFTMRVERSVEGIWRLEEFCNWRLSYLQALGEPESTAARLSTEFQSLLDTFDRFLPALPPQPRDYFVDLRSLVADAGALADRWRTIRDPAGSHRQR